MRKARHRRPAQRFARGSTTLRARRSGRRLMRLVAALLIVPLLAGCLSTTDSPDDALETRSALAPGSGIDWNTLSPDVYGILPAVREYVPATLDGILLHAQVHLPDGDGPWPAILQLSPYNDHGPTTAVGSYPGQGLVERYVPKGYAVVIADVRGTGDSEGCMEMMGPKERQDAYDMVEWVAAQDWSDGKVGMQGVSYVGTTPHEALVMAPPHLDAVVTVAGVTNQWRNVYQNGVPYLLRFYPITYEVTQGAPPPTDFERGAPWALNTAQGTCEQEEAVEAMAPGTYESGVYSEYWDARNMTRFAAQAQAPILYSQGFSDRAVNPMEAVGWFNELPVVKKGFFHQEGHRYPPRDDYFDTELAWFDHWLKGVENGVETSPTVEVQLNNGAIRTGTTWPPVDVAQRVFYLGPEALTEDAPAAGEQTYLADNGRGATRFSLSAARDTVGEAAASVGYPTELVYESEPLAESLHLAGSARMHLIAAVGGDNSYFLFDLVEVGADGTRTWLAEGWFNAHLHEGFDHAAPLTPGQTYEFDFAFEPIEYVVKAGSRIAVELKGSDPAVHPFDEVVTLNTVHYGPEGSHIALPFLENPAVFPTPGGI